MPYGNDTIAQSASDIATAAQSSLLHAVADAMPAQMAYFAAAGLQCQFANERFAQANGTTPDGLLGRSLQQVLSTAAWQANAAYIQRCQAGLAQHYSLQAQGRSGKTHMLEIHLGPHTEAGRVLGIFVLVYDVTHHWQTEQAVRESEERLRKFSMASEEIILFHHDGVILDANHAAERLTGYSIADLRGRCIFDFIHPEDRARAMNLSRQLHEDPYEVAVQRSDGRYVDIEVTAKSLRRDNGQVHRIVVARDISVRKQAQAQAAFITQHDLLTGLPNRQHLLQHTEQMLQQMLEQKEQAALLFINLDHFKTINDSLGHFVGDEVLQTMAQRLKSSVRPQDFVARLGSDEFVILIPYLQGRQQAQSVAEKLLLAINTPHTLAGMPITLSPSIGVSLFPEHGVQCEELLRRANQAMIAAKESGRANYQLYTAAMDGRVPYEELVLERQLREAIEQGQFVLHYQPQVCLSNGHLAGFEALVRWQHPVRGILGPDKFIPFAEKRGLISGIGRWVLFEACRQLKEWHTLGLPKVPVAVNVSPLELRQRDVLADIQRALQTTELQPQYLEIEITESVLMQQSSPAHNILTALQQLGVSISIDDFGTGYSSLAYLKRYPVDKLKIDRSFITDTPDSVDDVAIVTAIIQMGQSLQLQVVAEGVELPEQQAMLRHLGCDLVQGFGLSRPLAANQVLPWWQAWDARPLFV